MLQDRLTNRVIAEVKPRDISSKSANIYISVSSPATQIETRGGFFVLFFMLRTLARSIKSSKVLLPDYKTYLAEIVKLTMKQDDESNCNP